MVGALITSAASVLQPIPSRILAPGKQAANDAKSEESRAPTSDKDHEDTDGDTTSDAPAASMTASTESEEDVAAASVILQRSVGEIRSWPLSALIQLLNDGSALRTFVRCGGAARLLPLMESQTYEVQVCAPLNCRLCPLQLGLLCEHERSVHGEVRGRNGPTRFVAPAGRSGQRLYSRNAAWHMCL